MARLKDFTGVENTNFFEHDRGFQTLLASLLPDGDAAEVFDSLRECGGLVASRWDRLAREASRNKNLPRIVKQDRVGNPTERVELSLQTRQLRREVAEFGVLTKTRSEVHKFSVTYLLAHNAEASLTCGLSCTDGLIRAIEARGSEFLRERYLTPLRSADTPFAGAQFVTEQDGGSDVGAIAAEARPNSDGTWAITGEKWFCSNPDEFYLVAARPAGAHAGTAGVAVFMIPRLLPDGSLNRLSFKRLKDKLGTRSLPTAEVDFNGATGYPIGDVGEGFKTLMNYVINTSRIHNAVNACGFLHRAFLEARNYARQREAFGSALIHYPLVQESLVNLLERLWRYRSLTFRLVALVDRNGLAPDDPEQAMWQRFLINLAKYRTASTLTNSMREAILIFGGNGIVEDFTVLPRLLRDAMIIETWEGTHNTLCLQILRDAAKSDLLARWRGEVSSALEKWPQGCLAATRDRFEQSFRQTDRYVADLLTDRRRVETHARRAVDRLGALLEIGWVAEMAAWGEDEDGTAALLTAVAGHNLLPGTDEFGSPIWDVLAEYALPLIEEQPVSADLSAL